MIKPFEFYFDFASPYAYLAHKEIRKIEKENSIEIIYKPILLGGLLKKTGIKANIDIPIKAKYMIKDCKLWAKKYKTEFKFNDFFPIITLNLMRAAIVAEKNKISKRFIDKIFDSIWAEGLDLNNREVVEKIFKILKIDSKDFLTKTYNESIKEELKKRTDEAIEKGIFGTPSFVVNKKMFWGQDRLEFAVNEAKK